MHRVQSCKMRSRNASPPASSSSLPLFCDLSNAPMRGAGVKGGELLKGKRAEVRFPRESGAQEDRDDNDEHCDDDDDDEEDDEEERMTYERARIRNR